MQLTKSPVLFNEEPHEYWLGDKQLQGITQVVNWLFDKTYEGISKATLDNAARHGKYIHHLCQEYDEQDIVSDEPQVQDYIYLTAELVHVASEYIVSDEKDYASAIDKIYNGTEGGAILGDIKSTSSLHMDRATMQLSIYAMLFEQMNPDVKVEKLIVIWLPKPQYGKARISECQRFPSELCREILDTFLNAPWEVDEIREKINTHIALSLNPYALQQLKTAEQKFVEMEKLADYYKKASEYAREAILTVMHENNIKKWVGEHSSITRKLASTRQSLDSKKVKELYPDVYADCVKESETKESLLIKIK